MATGKRSTLLMQGKERRVGAGHKPWRVRLYATNGGAGYQVMFRAPPGDGEPWKRVLRRAATEAEARQIFAQAEVALDTEQSTPTGSRERLTQTIAALGEKYVEDSRLRGKAIRTIQNRESRLKAHIVPAIGDVPVAKWRIEHSRKVMQHASATLHSARGKEDLRGAMAAMRKLAWRLGWLDRSIDPVDGLEIGRSTVLHGATTHYVDPRLRPETRQVDAMATGADALCGPDGTDPLMTRLPLFGTKIRVAAYGGLRLSEQNGLRAIDVFFDRGYVQVNGSWTAPRHAPGFRGPVKNHVIHEVPLPRSLMEGELLPRVKELLDLPPTAAMQQVLNRQEEERQRRAKLALRDGDSTLAWWNYPIDPADEQWLFVDTVTGLPVKPEMHNDRWHRVRRWVDEHDPDNAWPKTIVYRNLRHHAATKWFHEELGEPWEVVAQYLGDKLTTVLNHYVRAGEDALRDSVSKLADR
ncbi:tyrosine-type recombinase/integrase [Nocardioides sp. BGMRC 2183]|nr:tyrosine-type recombinase/integrase [Nocardioides sp. BGMRC 2183]